MSSSIPQSAPARVSILGVFAVLWGVGGVLTLLSQAVIRLTPWATELFDLQPPLSWWHWVVCAGFTFFMAYSEGYKGFQKAFSPRVVIRGIHLMHNPKPLHVLLAPLFCMGLFHANKKRKIVSWSITVGVICLILLVRQLEQPWRGIIDAGVVVGLTWGMLAILVFALRAMAGKPPQGAADLPGQ